MKKLSISSTTVITIGKTLMFAILLAACSERQEVVPAARNEAIDPIINESTDASALRKSCYQEGPNYNLNVFMRGEHGSFAFTKFRQLETETQFIHLDTWVFGLEPNTSYVLQRAVDTTIDGDCTGTNWLTLGKGLDPQSIVTNSHGYGKAELWRSVASIPVGATFDIHFQIVKESTMEVVLSSDCLQYTVR